MSLQESMRTSRWNAIPPAVRAARSDRLFYRCACVVTALTAAVAILAVAITAVVLAMS